MPPLAAKTGQPGFARGKQANLASLPVTSLASPLGEEGHEVAKGWTVVRMIMIFLFYVSSPPQGKRLTTFCTSLTLPYKFSSLVQIMFAVHRFAQGTRSKKPKNFQSYSNSSTSFLTSSREQAKEPCIMSFPPPRPWRRVFHSLRRGFRFTVPLPMA